MIEAESPHCPVCSTREHARKYALTHFAILRCSGCGLVYLWPRPSEEEIRVLFESLYTSGEGSVPELKTYYGYCYDDVPDNPLVRTYEGWLDAIEAQRRPGRLLDIGCGTGLFLAVARRRGWEPHGIDESEEATRYAREHFGLTVHTGEFSQLATGGLRFDAITGWDILEHARTPLVLLDAMRESLDDQGVVALSTPNQANVIDRVAAAIYHGSAHRVRWPLEKFYIEQHFIYFTPETLADTLRRGGLEVLEMKRELTDLRRLTLSRPMRVVLESLFAVARLTGLENRLFAIARAAGSLRR